MTSHTAAFSLPKPAIATIVDIPYAEMLESQVGEAVKTLNTLLNSAAYVSGIEPEVTVDSRDTGLSRPIPQVAVTINWNHHFT